MCCTRGYPPVLFDLEADPWELNDLGQHPDYEEIRRDLHEKIFIWMRGLHTRLMTNDRDILEAPLDMDDQTGILIGYW